VSTGTIIGIAVGAVVVLLLIALVARGESRRRDERRREQAGVEGRDYDGPGRDFLPLRREGDEDPDPRHTLAFA
jgi:hypothetical protein